MKKLVIFSMDAFGDNVLRQPFFKALLDLGYDVTVVCSARFSALFPYLDHRLKILVSKVDTTYFKENEKLNELKQLILNLRSDCLVSITFDYSLLEMYLMSTFQEVERYGFYNPQRFLEFKWWHPKLYRRLGFNRNIEIFDHLLKLKENPLQHAYNKTQEMFKFLTGHELKERPQLHIPQEESLQFENAAILKKLGLEVKKYVLTCVAGITNHPIKALPIETSAKVIRYFQTKYNLPSLLIGVESERKYLEKVSALCETLGVKPKIWIGEASSFSTLLCLIRDSKFYYGADTGTMHMAAALNLPIVAHFGGGTWPMFLPLAERSYVVTQKLPCFACKWECWAKEAMCIHSVVPENLYQAVDWIMDESKQGNIRDEGKAIDARTEQLIMKKNSSAKRKKRMIKILPRPIIENTKRAKRLILKILRAFKIMKT